MSEVTIKRYMCDLCSRKKEEAGAALPKGWTKVVVENPHVDRDFTDKHVCDHCTGDIARAGSAK